MSSDALSFFPAVFFLIQFLLFPLRTIQLTNPVPISKNLLSFKVIQHGLCSYDGKHVADSNSPVLSCLLIVWIFMGCKLLAILSVMHLVWIDGSIATNRYCRRSWSAANDHTPADVAIWQELYIVPSRICRYCQLYYIPMGSLQSWTSPPARGIPLKKVSITNFFLGRLPIYENSWLLSPWVMENIV